MKIVNRTEYIGEYTIKTSYNEQGQIAHKVIFDGLKDEVYNATYVYDGGLLECVHGTKNSIPFKKVYVSKLDGIHVYHYSGYAMMFDMPDKEEFIKREELF